MPVEGNGITRLDRIEIILERLAKHMDAMAERMDAMAQDHEREFKGLLKWQVLMQDKMDRMQASQQAEAIMRKQTDEYLDARVDKLVTAIGDLIQQMRKPN